jgi:hypothetical protein
VASSLNLGRITRSKNATAWAFASGSSGGSFHALSRGMCWTILGTLIVAAWAGFGRLRGRVVTMVVMGDIYVAGGVWATR